MDELRIGVDLDGVVYRWSDTAKYLLEHHLGYHNLGESTYWEYLPDRVSPRAWKWLWGEGITRYGLFRHGNVYRGAFDALDALAREGSLVIITSRPGNARQDTKDWLDFHRVPYDELHILGGEPKSTVEPHCDVYVDDSPKNVKDLAENTDARVLLMTRPWNEGLPTGDVFRVETWTGVLNHVKGVKTLREMAA